MSIDIKEFMNDCRSRGLTKHTIETYRSNVTTFLNFVGDPLNVDTSILRNFLDYLREDMVYTVGKTRKKGVSHRTLSAYFSAISSYYDYLIYEGTLDINPILPFRKRYLANNRPKTNGENTRQLISIDEMAQLIKQAELILHIALMLVLAKTGVRKGEHLAMDLQDLSPEKGTIIIKPKAKRTNRLAFIDNETIQVMREYLEWREPRARCEALWISPRGQRMHKDDPYEIITGYAVKLGLHDPEGSLNRKLTPHCFRHWFTTHLHRAGMSREFIQELRGDSHEDAFDIYNHIDHQDLREEYMGCIPVLDIDVVPSMDMATMATGLGFKPLMEHQKATMATMATMATEAGFKNSSEPQRATMATMATAIQNLKGLNHDIFSLICDIPGLKPTEIAKHFNKKPNYIRSYLHRLEKQGLIYKDNYSRCFINSPSPGIHPEQGQAFAETVLMEV
jgi:integrase/recombinase XerD